jgi:hypothetical protein
VLRVWSVVRSPALESSTASAVPNEPAPITVALRATGLGSVRARGRVGFPPGVGVPAPCSADAAGGLGVGSGVVGVQVL